MDIMSKHDNATIKTYTIFNLHHQHTHTQTERDRDAHHHHLRMFPAPASASLASCVVMRSSHSAKGGRDTAAPAAAAPLDDDDRSWT